MTDLAKLADAVEAAWDEWDAKFIGTDDIMGRLARATNVCHRVTDLLAARRAARAAGYVECLLSREAVAALRDIYNGAEASEGLMAHVLRLVLHDLAALLKEPT
jgi:hypothetical protein